MQKNILKIENLTVKYEDTSIINNANFEVKEGDFIMVSGANGSGKSTLIKALAGALDGGQAHGKIEFDGENILEEKDIQEYRRKIAYVEQESVFVTKTARDEIDFCASISGESLTRDQIEEFFAKHGLQNMVDMKISALSGGQKKMLSILSALIRDDARLFLIDEPLNNLDMKNVCAISDLITDIHLCNPSAAIILISHCRIFPNVGREIEVVNGELEERVPKQCYSCFGEPNTKGYYNK